MIRHVKGNDAIAHNNKQINRKGENTMTTVKATTQKGQSIIWDHRNARYNDIFDAYEKPSSKKITAWLNIRRRALETPGYNHDLRVAGRSSHQFSTVYSFTDESGKTTIVKDTAANIYAVTI